MTEKIIIAGSGGQGIMLMGKVLAQAAMEEGKFVTWLPSYGAEVRGGTAHCMVIISDAKIGSPYVDKADAAVILNAPSLDRFKGRIKAGGLLVINSSLAAQETGNKKINALSKPFTDIAIKLGNIKVANMAALGCYLSRRKTVRPQSVSSVMEEIAPSDKKALVEINIKALEEGLKL